MKITQEQKEKNREKLLTAFVDLVTAKGVKAATMRDVTRAAGMGEATIYNYFPTKEAMVYAYYQDQFEALITALTQVPDFHTYTFQEQLQTAFETQLSLLIRDREFVGKTFKDAFLAMSQDYARVRPVKEVFIRIVRDIFEAAVEAGEIQDQVFLELMVQFFWEYDVGLVVYWLKDDSESFQATTTLIDKSIDLASASIRAGIANKVFDMGIFLFKNHVLSRMDLVRERVDMLHGIKRRFMEGTRD